MSAEFSPRKRVAFGILLVSFIGCVLEALSYIAILLSGPYLDERIRRTPDIYREQSAKIRKFVSAQSLGRTVFDSNLGWRYRANYHSNGDQLNGQGLRSSRDYTTIPAGHVIRVAAFGDSFVYCNEVGNQGSWPHMIEKMNRDIEVLNYGVGGYGTDQAYLRFLSEGTSLSPDVVVIGFSPIMLRRAVNVYRRFISTREFPLVKPRFVLNEKDSLVLLRSPLQNIRDYESYLRHPAAIVKLGAHDHWYQPAIYENPIYNVSATVRLLTTVGVRVYNRYLDQDRLLRDGVFNRSSIAFRIQAKLLSMFVDHVRNFGAKALIVVFPGRGAIVNAMQGKQTAYSPLLDHLTDGGLDYVDLSRAFVEQHSPDKIGLWFMPEGHYSPIGNEIVARWLAPQIEARHQTTD